MLGFLKKIFDYNEKELKRLRIIVDEINSIESRFKKLSDKKLKEKTNELKQQINNGVDLKQLIPEAFATVREASRRTIGQRHFDVQLMAAISLFEGKIAEQKTGEGKTLSATPALYLRALVEKGAHLVTVNDYLAQIGCGWMGDIFNFLGLSVGCIIPDKSFIYDFEYKTQTDDRRLVHLRQIERKDAYLADITYGTNNEFGFDYLRDNMSYNFEDVIQREHYFAIVDEIDFALIDEARTPLIISSPQEKVSGKYVEFSGLASELQSETDYVIDEKAGSATLTEYGIRKIERKLGVDNLYEEDFETIHQIENALKARTLFHRNKDYVVQDGQIIIVDEFTGRLMNGRRWSDGLHQAIEAKEGVEIQQESKTWATITFQNYFRMYEVLSGMTGTAATESEEFRKIYNLDVVIIPTNKPTIRNDFPDVIYKTQRAKYAAIAAEIEECYKKGQPVLVGTTSVEKNEMIGQFLTKKKIPHQILNAKHHQKEATIISQAGKSGSVTVATNMAGRGVDIILGGDEVYSKSWEKEHKKIVDLGGLYVIGTERHEARRIDNQLRGRSGRQGDPGSSKFFISLEDDLMRIFGGEQISSLMTKFHMPENMPISHSMVSKMIRQIQVKIEGFNYDIRKSLVEFDDIVNKQREIIYKLRRDILKYSQHDQLKIKELILNKIKKEIEIIFDLNIDPESLKPLFSKITLNFAEIIALESELDRKKIEKKIENLDKEKAIKKLMEIVTKIYQAREEYLGEKICRDIEKSLFLSVIDTLWVDHLTALDNLKEGVRLRGYGQRDPLVEYRKESYEMFKELISKIDYHISRRILRVEVQPQIISNVDEMFEGRGEARVADGKVVKPKQIFANSQPNIGRNDLCPCGSGKKYKKCHINNQFTTAEEKSAFDLYFNNHDEWIKRYSRK